VVCNNPAFKQLFIAKKKKKQYWQLLGEEDKW
jgi:hypothetical protein